MKLPAGKKERIQLLVLAAIGAVAIVFGIVQFLISPRLAEWKRVKARSKELEIKLNDASKEITALGRIQQDKARICAQLREIDEKYVAKDDFGVYILRVRADLERMAKEAGVKLDTASEVRRISLETGAGKKSSFLCYCVNVVTKCSYAQLAHLLAVVETNNPYASTVGIVISAGAKPDEHNMDPVSFYLPIWQDPLVATNFVPIVEEEDLWPEEQTGVATNAGAKSK